MYIPPNASMTTLYKGNPGLGTNMLSPSFRRTLMASSTAPELLDYKYCIYVYVNIYEF